MPTLWLEGWVGVPDRGPRGLGATMRALATRADRVAGELALATGVHVWMPADDQIDDGRVCTVGTGETIGRGEVDRRPARHIVVEYVEGSSPCG